MAITAPAAGVIVEKPVVQGARFVAGDTLLRLADLSTVWVTVNVPAAQVDKVRLGQPARFTSPSLAGQAFDGTVGFLQPMLDATSRTLAVRVALPNPDGRLRPGLFGTVALAGDDGRVGLTIPRSALIDSGQRQVALVEVAPGRFAPRPISIGQRSGDRVEVLDGLREGERVVVEGNFLIDAESNLRAALQDMAPAQATPSAEHDMASHEMPAAPATAHGAHVGHAMPSPATKEPAAIDPHAGHVMPDKPKADPHAGHDMGGHDMPDMEH